MEYYGNKYPEYSPILPSNIYKVLDSHKRLLPSEGLNVLQISTALKEFGFGTYLYDRNKENDDEFKRLLYYYIESGIPVVLGLCHDKIGHAVVTIGHANLTMGEIEERFNNANPCFSLPNSTEFFDTADLNRDLVQIDDNHPPYRSTSFDKPGSYYDKEPFKDLKIRYVVVPLYKKIYLEARKAGKLADTIIKNEVFGWEKNSSLPDKKLLKRLMLASSNSFKDFVAQSDYHEIIREHIVHLSMPKFVWIVEISTIEQYKKEFAVGLILIDATGSDTMKSILLAVYPGFSSIPGKPKEVIDFSYEPFGVFKNNLKEE